MTEDERIEQAKRAAAAPAVAVPTTLAEVQARRAAALARGEAAQAKHALKMAIREAEAQEVWADIVEARGEHSVAIVPTVGGPVVLERGPDAHWKSYRAETLKAGTKSAADGHTRRFVYALVRYPRSSDPAQSAVEDFFSDFPAALDPCSVAGAKLYGLQVAEDDPK